MSVVILLVVVELYALPSFLLSRQELSEGKDLLDRKDLAYLPHDQLTLPIFGPARRSIWSDGWRAVRPSGSGLS